MKNPPSYLLISILIAGGCNQSSTSIPINNSLNQKIDTYLQESISQLKIPGLSVAVTRNDSVVYSNAFGVKNIETHEMLKDNYIFHWASVSKTFTATAIMQLVEQDKISLDEKLITYLPYFKQKVEDCKDITIRQVLNHTSGIGDVKDYEWDKPQFDKQAAERYVRSLEKDEMLFKPGTDWSYSNTAFDILADVISKISGMTFEEYIKKNIFMPLEMHQSSFEFPDIPDSLRVKGHLWEAETTLSKVYPYNRIHAPSSTLNSSVLEMTHFAIANLHRGIYKNKRILADSSYNLLWSNSVNIKDKPSIGLSWFLNTYKKVKIVSHAGGDTGFRSFLLLVPEKNISVSLVSNYELCDAEGFAYAILDLVIGEKPKVIKREIGFHIAEISKQQGLTKAKEAYLKIKNDSTQYKNFKWEGGEISYPAYMLMYHEKLNEALELYKFDQELNPKSGYVYGNLGVIYARLGNKKLARFNLKKSIELLPDYPYYKEELDKLEN